MANTVTIQEINDGERNYVVNLNILGDGSGEETANVLCDASAKSVTSFRLDSVQGQLDGFDINLSFDADADDPLLSLRDGQDVSLNYRRHGGIPNPRSAGFTGNVIYTTVGLGSGDTATLTFHFVKKP